MRKILRKEMRLAASPLSYFFIAFGLLTMVPGYPILLGAFFVSFGIFQSFQVYRESNDIVYSLLLPISKEEVVKGKYLFSVTIELLGFLVMVLCTAARMTVLCNSTTYRANVMMNANLVSLAFALVIFGVFNWIFIGGFFKTAYYYGKYFIFYVIAVFLIVGVGEALHHIPGCGSVNAFGFTELPLQLAFLVVGIVLYLLFTVLSMRASIRRFDQIDL